MRGFTLLEMLVVLAIIVIITVITLFGHANFDRSTLLTDTAYTIALSTRQMQTLGLSSRAFGAVTNVGYGVHVSTLTPTSYVLFADTSASGGVPAYCPVGTAGTPEAKPGNCLYTAGADGIVQTYTLTRGFRVTEVCGRDTGNVRRCSTTGGAYLQAVNAVFVRPNTESILSGQRVTSGNPWIELKSVEIYLRAADNLTTRAVCISQVGQVSVTTGTCP